MLILHVIQGPDRGMRFELPSHEPQLLGRSSEALPITDKSVSRRHAELTPDNGRWLLRDLASANGTYVNGHRIDHEQRELAPGDQIRCGSTLMLFNVAHSERRPSPVSIFDPDDLESSVERRLDPSEESMILAEPDPVQAAMHHLRIIYELTALIASCIDREELLNRIMDLIFDEFNPDRGFIILTKDADCPPEHSVVRYQVRPRTVDEGRIPVSRTIVQHTLVHGDGILSTNAMNDRRFQSGDSVREYGIRSAICVPLRAAERTLGVIHVDSSVANFTFTESQLALMNAIGQHAGLALQNLELVRDRVQHERLAAVGQTIASLSHSIKNILQGLRGGADAVELAINRDDINLCREAWPILSRNLDRIYALTLNMLAYSKHRTLELEMTDLRHIIDDATELIQPQCDRKRAGLIVDYDDGLPPVPVDPNALHQAIMNLLTNAVEAVPERKGMVTISTEYVLERQEAKLSVSDNGPGIESDRHETIFEAFRSTKGQRGTGLGLAVTRKIVEEHGGHLELQSQLREGSTFTITLPCDTGILTSGDTSLPRPLPTSDPVPDGP